MMKIALSSVNHCIAVNLQPDRTKQSLSSENTVAKTGTNSKSALHVFIAYIETFVIHVQNEVKWKNKLFYLSF